MAVCSEWCGERRVLSGEQCDGSAVSTARRHQSPELMPMKCISLHMICRCGVTSHQSPVTRTDADEMHTPTYDMPMPMPMQEVRNR
jgi:hypothetical protein